MIPPAESLTSVDAGHRPGRAKTTPAARTVTATAVCSAMLEYAQREYRELTPKPYPRIASIPIRVALRASKGERRESPGASRLKSASPTRVRESAVAGAIRPGYAVVPGSSNSSWSMPSSHPARYSPSVSRPRLTTNTAVPRAPRHLQTSRDDAASSGANSHNDTPARTKLTAVLAFIVAR